MYLPIKKIFWVLTGVVIMLLGIYTWNVMAWHIVPQGMPEFFTIGFDINAEANIPTWYATILLLLVSVSAFLIFTVGRRKDPKDRWMYFWIFFGLVYGFFSMDEAAVIHEMLDTLPNFKWIVVYAPLALLFFLACAYYFFIKRKKDMYLRNWIISGLIVYIAGALGCEWVSYNFDLVYALQMIELVAEEGLEMLGTIMVLMGCLTEINHLMVNREVMDVPGSA
jgi:uncharacterized membrane protein YhaH (DUF805 family)